MPALGFTALTLMPSHFRGFSEEGVFANALRAGIVSLELRNYREFTSDARHTVDGRAVGGSDGMVLRVDVVHRALLACAGPGSLIVQLCPTGHVFDQRWAHRLAAQSHVVFLCGRYGGFDARTERYVHVRLSLGDMVLSGGECAAMAMMDAAARLKPGVLGNAKSPLEDSFCGGLLEPPQYTKPLDYQGDLVPGVLLGGDHKAAAQFRRRAQIVRTALSRSDLLRESWDSLTASEKALAARTWKSGTGQAPAAPPEDL